MVESFTLSRRIFLRTGLTTTGLLAIPFSPTWARIDVDPIYVTDFLNSLSHTDLAYSEYFTQKELCIIRAAADRILPGDPSRDLPCASEVQTAERLDKLLPRILGTQSLKDFKLLLGLLDFWSLGLFTSYGPRDQDRYLREWENSFFSIHREAFRALKKLITVGYFSNESVWPKIGYKGPYGAIPKSRKEPIDLAIGPTLPPVTPEPPDEIVT